MHLISVSSSLTFWIKKELLKLRRKITNVVQVLTHVKEKLQFVQEDNDELKQELNELERQVSGLRDRLPAAKSERDSLRVKHQSLRDRNGLLGNVPLLRDFEDKMVRFCDFCIQRYRTANMITRLKNTSQYLKSQIDALKEMYHSLNRESTLLKRKMQKMEFIAGGHRID